MRTALKRWTEVYSIATAHHLDPYESYLPPTATSVDLLEYKDIVPTIHVKGVSERSSQWDTAGNRPAQTDSFAISNSSSTDGSARTHKHRPPSLSSLRWTGNSSKVGSAMSDRNAQQAGSPKRDTATALQAIRGPAPRMRPALSVTTAHVPPTSVSSSNIPQSPLKGLKIHTPVLAAIEEGLKRSSATATRLLSPTSPAFSNSNKTLSSASGWKYVTSADAHVRGFEEHRFGKALRSPRASPLASSFCEASRDVRLAVHTPKKAHGRLLSPRQF